uniref:Putative signal peptide peptidase-like 2A n=1 Tax=Schistosoma japonicum TaxID=6182 RepID=C1LGN9_SCHJA|nr:putative signal peptide peptidase-like 2A [Schistosoma japonicum]
MKVACLVLGIILLCHQTGCFHHWISILKVYENNNVSSYRCYQFSRTEQFDPFLSVTKLKLIDLTSPPIKDHSYLPSSLSSLSISVIWNNFNDADILSIDPQLLIIVYEGQLNPKLKMIFESHSSNVFNRSLIFLDTDQFNDIISEGHSHQPNANNISVSVFLFTANTMMYNLLIWILLYGFVMISFLLASWMIIVNREKLLLDCTQRHGVLSKSKLFAFLSIIMCLAVAVISLLISYFFYDIIVYIIISAFVLVGTISVSDFLKFVIQRIFPSTNKVVTFNAKCCRKLGPKKVSILSLVTLPIGLAIAITWLVFRNDEMIGWPLQSVIGMLIVATVISSGLIIPSAKVGTLLLTAFLAYDIFFVFITPLFSSHTSATVSSTQNIELSRTRRSNTNSYMEAVATGTAGKSGELLPLAFRLLVNEYVEVNKQNIEIIPHTSLLGFGDAVIPGIFLMFLIFYDACWRIPYYRHYLGGLLGYSLGFMVTIIVLHVTKGSQPALLYLCPFILFTTFVVVVTCDGLSEWKLLWSGSLPVLTNVNVDTNDANEVDQSPNLLEVLNIHSSEDKSINDSKIVLI